MTLFRTLGILFAVSSVGIAAGQEFKSARDCVVGAKVQTRQDKVGTIAKVDGTMCQVQFADGSRTSTLFWMLRPAGASQQTTDKLVPGTYPCYYSAGSTTNYAFMDVVIEDGGRYRDKKGNKGKYRWDEKSGKVTFESGPFEKANAKLFRGPKIGLNMDGKSMFNMMCGLKK